MSNVIIGIVGVILFIGLALASALFLGPQFVNIASDVRANTVIQSLSQIAIAANKRAFDTDTDYTTANAVTLVVSDGYMKAVPAPPIGTGAFKLARRGTAMWTNTAGSAEIVVFPLGTSTDLENLCREIETSGGGSANVPVISSSATATTSTIRRFGCFRQTTALPMSGGAANAYVAYYRI